MAALQAVLTLPCTNPSNNRVKMYIKISCFFQRMGLFNASQFFCNVFAKYIKYKKKKKKKTTSVLRLFKLRITLR